jgi:hypothetical protein
MPRRKLRVKRVQMLFLAVLTFSRIGQAAQRSSKEPTVTTTAVTVQAGQTVQVNFVVNAKGVLNLLIPDTVAINVPFKMDASYLPDKPVNGARANVFFDRGTNVQYDPPELILEPFRRKQITVTVKKAPSGLARIAAYSGCCPDRIATVLCDFKGRLRALDPDNLESRKNQPVSVLLEDNQGRPLILDSDLDLRIATYNADVSADGKIWQTTIVSKIRKGAARSDFVYIRPTPVDVADGHIQVTGFGDGGNVAFSDDLAFKITSPWWLKLGMAMLGAFLYALYKRLNSPADETEVLTFLKSLGAALVAGAFAYELANLNVFGIKLDTTSLHGFVMLGLLTAYVGVEPLLSKLVERRTQRTTGFKPVRDTPVDA